MSDLQASFCTDEELLTELKKLGHNDVSDEMLDLMKKDLSQILLNEVISCLNSPRAEEVTLPSKIKSNPTFQNKFESSVPQVNHKSLPSNSSFVQRKPNKDDFKRFGQLKTKLAATKSIPLDQPEKMKSENVSADSSSSDTPVNRYLNSLERQQSLDKKKADSPKADSSSSTSSTSSVSKIKRKVLRHRNGRTIITEEFLDMPSAFSSSYPETCSSFSGEEVSWESSISSETPGDCDGRYNVPLFHRTLSHISDSFETKSVRSTRFHVTHPKKKSDPVAMYNYYKTFWNNFKPPGEKTHNKLRWTVRDKMLEYHL